MGRRKAYVKDLSVNIGLDLGRGLFLSLRSQCGSSCFEALLRFLLVMGYGTQGTYGKKLDCM